MTDCDADCAQPAASAANPGLYYACDSAQTTGCQIASVAVAQQIPNPVAVFPVDNNGAIIQLPMVPSAGAPSVSGVVVFGIGTQTNNGLGNAQVFPLNIDGYVETAYPAGGAQYTSYLDSGSNAIFVRPEYNGNSNLSRRNEYLLLPVATTNLNAAVLGSGTASVNVGFSVTNADELAARNFAFSDLAGPMGGYPDPQQPSFDWGLPFFFGRSVYTAIEGRSTPAGAGPYFAF